MESIDTTTPESGQAVHPSRTTPDSWIVIPDPAKSTPRPRLKSARLSAARGAKVRAIADRWESEGAYSPNLEQAILLWDAVTRADLDAVQEIAPLLVAALSKSRKTRRSPLSLRSDLDSRSDSKKVDLRVEEGESLGEGMGEGDTPGEDELRPMMTAVADVTETNLDMNEAAIWPVAEKLLNSGYSAEEVRVWHRRWWPVSHPRGRAGEPPRPEWIPEHIEKVRRLPPEQSGPPVSKYLQDRYFEQERKEIDS